MVPEPSTTPNRGIEVGVSESQLIPVGGLSMMLKLMSGVYGDPFCPIEPGTGSHLLRVKCVLPGAYRLWNDGEIWLPTAR